MDTSNLLNTEHAAPACDDEAQLHAVLEHETDFACRQELLKALWRLSQPAKVSGPDASNSSRREPEQVKVMHP